MKYGYLILSLVGALSISINSVSASETKKRPPVTIGANRQSIDLNSQKSSWRFSQQFNCNNNCTSVPAMHCVGPENSGYYAKCIQTCKKELVSSPSYTHAIKKCEELMQRKQYLGQVIEFDYVLPFAEPGTPGSRGYLVKVLRKKASPSLGFIDFTDHNDNIIAFLPYSTKQPINPGELIGKMIEFEQLDHLEFSRFTDAQLEAISQDDKSRNYMNNDYKAFFIVASPEIVSSVKAYEEEDAILPGTSKFQPSERSALPID